MFTGGVLIAIITLIPLLICSYNWIRISCKFYPSICFYLLLLSYIKDAIDLH